MKRSLGYATRGDTVGCAAYQAKRITLCIAADWSDHPEAEVGRTASQLAFRLLYDRFESRKSLPSESEFREDLRWVHEQLAAYSRDRDRAFRCRLGVLALDKERAIAHIDNGFRFVRYGEEARFEENTGVLLNLIEEDTYVICTDEEVDELDEEDVTLPHRSLRNWVNLLECEAAVGVGVVISLSFEFTSAMIPPVIEEIFQELDGEKDKEEALRLVRLQDEERGDWNAERAESETYEEEASDGGLHGEGPSLDEEEEEEEDSLWDRLTDALVALEDYVESAGFQRRALAALILGGLVTVLVLLQNMHWSAEDVRERAEDGAVVEVLPEEGGALEQEAQPTEDVAQEPEGDASREQDASADAEGADEEPSEEVDVEGGVVQKRVVQEQEPAFGAEEVAGAVGVVLIAGLVLVSRRRQAREAERRTRAKKEFLDQIAKHQCVHVSLGGDEQHALGLTTDGDRLVFSRRQEKVTGTESRQVVVFSSFPVSALVHTDLTVRRGVTVEKKGRVKATCVTAIDLSFFLIGDEGNVVVKSLSLVDDEVAIGSGEYETLLATVRYWEGFALAVCPSFREAESNWEEPLELRFGGMAV